MSERPNPFGEYPIEHLRRVRRVLDRVLAQRTGVTTASAEDTASRGREESDATGLDLIPDEPN